MKINVRSCQRCGTDHYKLEFQTLEHPADNYNWWATCPIVKEPVLLAITTDGEKKPSHIEKTIHVGPGTKLVIIETKDLPRGSIVIEGASPV